MRICWAFLFKMLRYISRLNIALVIICLGAVVFIWSRCNVRQLERELGPRVELSTRRYVKDSFENGRVDNEREQVQDDTEEEREENSDTFDKENQGESEKKSIPVNEKPASYKSIEVLVNGDNKLQGRLEGKEVYIPFSFVKEHFEIEGEFVNDDFGKQFHVRHTSYEYFRPKTKTYNPLGSFLWFVNYNVEGRSRVKCITGLDEVPISTQWSPDGYRYPIQIAQYGLSHFSMLSEHEKGDKKVMDDFEGTSNQDWTGGKGAHMNKVFNVEKKSQVMEFDTSDSSESVVTLPLGSSSKMFVLSFDILFKSKGRIEVKLEVGDTKTYTLVYDTSKVLLKTNKQTATYGIGPTQNWRKITRNLWIDLSKPFGEKGRKKEGKKRGKLRISEVQSLTLYGKGCIDNITLMENGHEAAFLASARWLLENQDNKGGWPIPVKRRIRTGVEIKPGWYSAMAQGQAISVLTRAYHVTKDPRFLKAAKRATGLFRVKSKDNGILAVYLNRFKWYEEYPSTPSLFVLNGFLYSLMGLYDLKMTLPSDQRGEAEALFKDGMTSLRAMIHMFDSGSGTIYDLRHLTMDVEPNLARWDYHATHVNQVTWLTMIDSDPFYKQVLKRWQGYFKGIRARHN